MEKTIERGGAVYALAPMTRALGRKAQAMRECQDPIRAYDAKWDFLAAAMGSDALREATGAKGPDDVDMCDMDELVALAEASYASGSMDRLDAMLAQVDVERIERVMDLAGRMQGRQGFKLVR